jgi:hypothetical protein
MESTDILVLSVNSMNMEEKKENKSPAVVEVIDSGPLKISGNFFLKDLKKDISDNSGEVYLCRCGRSGNKPYCDCSHKK